MKFAWKANAILKRTPLQIHLGSGHFHPGADAEGLPATLSGVTLITGHRAVSQGRTAEVWGGHDERMSWT